MFEFISDYRGAFASLQHADGHRVILIDWPESFLSMLRAGVLGPEARKEAKALRDADLDHRDDLESHVYYRGRRRRVDVVARLE